MNNYLIPPWGEPKGSHIRHISPISPISLIRPISLPPPPWGRTACIRMVPYYQASAVYCAAGSPIQGFRSHKRYTRVVCRRSWMT